MWRVLSFQLTSYLVQCFQLPSIPNFFQSTNFFGVLSLQYMMNIFIMKATLTIHKSFIYTSIFLQVDAILCKSFYQKPMENKYFPRGYLIRNFQGGAKEIFAFRQLCCQNAQSDMSARGVRGMEWSGDSRRVGSKVAQSLETWRGFCQAFPPQGRGEI